MQHTRTRARIHVSNSILSLSNCMLHCCLAVVSHEQYRCPSTCNDERRFGGGAKNKVASQASLINNFESNQSRLLLSSGRKRRVCEHIVSASPHGLDEPTTARIGVTRADQSIKGRQQTTIGSVDAHNGGQGGGLHSLLDIWFQRRHSYIHALVLPQQPGQYTVHMQ